MQRNSDIFRVTPSAGRDPRLRLLVDKLGHNDAMKKWYCGTPDVTDKRLESILAVHKLASNKHPKPARYGELFDLLKNDFHVGCCIPYFTEYIHDVKGELLECTPKFSNSFIQYMAGCLQQLLDSGSTVSMDDTGGTTRSVTSASSSNLDGDVIAANADNSYGTVWGTGTNNEAVADKKLQTIIAHGNSTLNYGACSVGNFAAGSTSATVTITRTGTNGTGGITVEERGVYIRMQQSSAWKFGIIRDKAQKVISAGNSITTVYTLDFAN